MLLVLHLGKCYLFYRMGNVICFKAGEMLFILQLGKCYLFHSWGNVIGFTAGEMLFFCSWGNTFPIGQSYNSRPIQRNSYHTSPKQVTSNGAQWCFGAKRSVLGGTMSWGHLPVQRNSSHNTMMFNNPGVIEV